MKNISKSIVAVLVLGALVGVMSGCQKKEGPAEKAGQSIDKATEKAGQKIDKAVEKSGEKIEKAGEKMKDSTK
jgi:vacuolar-type H+-ATPase subunit H